MSALTAEKFIYDFVEEVIEYIGKHPLKDDQAKHVLI